MRLSPQAPGRLAAALGITILSAAAAFAAVSVGPQTLPAGSFERAAAPMPLRLAEGMSLEAARALPTAEVGAADQLAAMRAWNQAGRVPAKAGFHRPLVEPLAARISPALWNESVGREAGGGWTALSPRGTLVWGTSVAVDGASRLRLHLTDVTLPEGTRLWVYAVGEAGRAFDLEYLHPERGLWTPSVLGDRIHLEVEIPESARAGRWGFSISEVSQIFDARGTGHYLSAEASPEDCLEFGSCFDATDFAGYDGAMHGVFNYVYEDGPDSFTCSAGLLNDTDAGTTKLWALTANHCISSTSADNSVEPLYNYYFVDCPWTGVNGDDGPIGATIVATGAIPEPDFTLMDMNTSGIDFILTLLGWTDAPVGSGVTGFKLSHPVAMIPDSGDPNTYILPQMYSEHISTNNPDFLCEDGDGTIETDEVTLANFIYTVTTLGTTVGGSSGSPIMLANGQVVGQLLGKCSAGDPDSCNYDVFNNLDGRLEKSFGALEPFLDPSPTGDCVPNATTVCLNDGRFRVNVLWTDFGGVPHDAFVSGQSTADTGIFFFNSADNLEFMVKVLDGCPINSRYWVFAAGATDVGYVITVTDTAADASKQYSNPLGTAAPAITDTSAFATCP
jgi:hypothetical protein